MSFSCARIFSDHMVLQRNQSIAVFGTAPAGICVAAELNGSCAEGIADVDGKWLIRLPAMAVRYAYTNWTDANVYQTNGIPLPQFERTL